MFMRLRSSTRSWLAAVALALTMTAGPAFADPPSRVVRLAHISGDVSFQNAGEDDSWVVANLNRPLVPGDGLFTDRASRVEMGIGAASVRLDERSNFRVLSLDDSFAQFELTEGVLNLHVRRIFDGDSYEIDTPTLAFVVDQPGRYRIDIAPDGNSSMITVFDGGGTVYGEGNARYSVRDGQTYRFHDVALRDYEVLDLPRGDEFDRWCLEREGRYERSVSRQYVSEDVIGYADLDDYGSWSSVETYGSVWFPSRVDAGWAPYRNGHWSWIDPWGWTWVDNSAWGFAPFHYGRWANVGSRWGWVPGPRHVRSIYAPALVAFVGGSNFGISISGGGPVGWFPLGPRDVYVPWYRGSRDYFNNINVRNTTIINNTYITNVYNDYSRGRNVNNFNYAYRNNDRAFTAVPRDAFVNARGVDRARLNMAPAQFGRGEVLTRVDLKPVAASFTGGAAVRNRSKPSIDVSRRAVIARTAPAARAVGIQGRMREIERNGNQPIAVNEMRQLSAARPRADNARSERIRVVGNPAGAATGKPQALPPRSAEDRVRSRAESPVAKPGRAGGDQRVAPNVRTPAAGERKAPDNDARNNNARTPIERERRLPSSEYAPGRNGANRERNATPAVERGANPNLPERRLSPDKESERAVRKPQAERAEPVREQPRIERPRDELQSQPRERAVQPSRSEAQQQGRQREFQQQQQQDRQREVKQQQQERQREVNQQQQVRQREVQPQQQLERQREVKQQQQDRQREVQQRQPQERPREIQQRQPREVQPQPQPQRSAPQSQRPPQQAPARENRKKDADDEDKKERKRRDE